MPCKYVRATFRFISCISGTVVLNITIDLPGMFWLPFAPGYRRTARIKLLLRGTLSVGTLSLRSRVRRTMATYLPLGGAIAIIATLYLSEQIPGVNLRTITYGSPRVSTTQLPVVKVFIPDLIRIQGWEPSLRQSCQRTCSDESH
jgi:hypothetical protein